MSYDVVVIGAGFAGLAAARDLAKNGFDPVVLEGRDRVGGRSSTTTLAGVPVDLGGTFVEAEGAVFLTSNGLVDDRTWKELPPRLPAQGFYVLPGFYGTGPLGKVKTFSRGGSDISGAILARAASASLYENWTDVSGLLMADPRIVPDAAPMERVTYRELRELAYSGANVFHEEAILPCKQVGIPIRIANTNDPAAKGTLIVPENQAAERPIAGVAGRNGFCLLQIEKTLMNKERGFGRRVLGILETKGISYELSPSGIDSMCVVIDQKNFEPVENVVLQEIRNACDPDAIDVERNLALIATVGHGMSRRVGVSSRLSAAALETLAIVAYKQPVSRAQVAALRGVNVDGVVRLLEHRGYITPVGRASGPGQAVLYATTDAFLERLGLDRLEQLPPVEDLLPGPEALAELEEQMRPVSDV